jgi:transposase InsO family protein
MDRYLAAIRVNTTESRFAASLNRLLQQNQHISDLPQFSLFGRYRVQIGRFRAEGWRRDYNNVRPHSRIGWLAPAVYAANF